MEAIHEGLLAGLSAYPTGLLTLLARCRLTVSVENEGWTVALFAIEHCTPACRANANRRTTVPHYGLAQHEDATLEPSFPIPQGRTRCYGLDPHPVVPHASLYCPVDPWGDAWGYHELPSRVSGFFIQISCCGSGPTGSSHTALSIERHGS